MRKVLFLFLTSSLAACTGTRYPYSTGFYAYEGGRDGTEFSCGIRDGRFRFSFRVLDSTVHAVETVAYKRDLERGDRVEVFFSPTADMSKRYYCAEIDPRGRVLDYSIVYPRKFDYTWSFRTLEKTCTLTPDGYAVEGSVSVEELKSFGIDPKRFWIGVFRADYDQDEQLVDWHSKVPHGPGDADFHRPCMLFEFLSEKQ